MIWVQESRAQVAKVRLAVRTCHVVARLALLHRRATFRTSRCAPLDEGETGLFLFVDDLTLGRDVDTSAVSEIAMPCALAYVAESVGAVFANLKTCGQNLGILGCFVFSVICAYLRVVIIVFE